MHDTRLEDVLRQTLREEASRLPLALSTDVLERRLADRRRARDKGRLWAVAAVAVFAVATSAAILAWSELDNTSVSATPSPLPTLPAPAALLTRYPEAVLVLEHAVGPSEGPTTTTAVGSPSPFEVGTVTFDGPFVIAIACLGGGEMVAEVSTPSLGVAYTQAVAACDGTPTYSEYFAPPLDPGSTGDEVTVTVPAGRPWRLAIGELPASVLEPPDLAAIELTTDWNLLSNLPATQVTAVAPHTGARLTVPAAARRVGVFVQCAEAGSVAVTFGAEPASDVPCDPEGITHRLEFPVTGGDVVSLDASADRPGVWVRMIVETDGRITTEYPTAPPLPAAVAGAPYVVPDANVVGIGTIGGNEQRILELAGAQPGRPSGDLLPVAVSSEGLGTTLHLVSVSSGDVLRTLVAVPPPAVIFDSWADTTRGRIYYGIARESAVEFRSVAVDGSDDRILATVARKDLTGFTADLAFDGSAFVVDACHAGSGCARTIVDAQTGTVGTVDRAADPICKILGIVDAEIIGTSRPTCTEDGVTSVVAVPIDGEPRVVMDDAPREIVDAVIVTTKEGVKAVYVGEVASGGGTVTVAVLDVATGATTTLPPSDVGDPRLVPYPLARLDGLVLLAGGGMGDFPWQKSFDRPVPVLLDVATGERIELVNLPHWAGTFGR